MKKYDVLKTDVLIIGGGAAGVRAGIEADVEGSDVLVASKGPLARSGLTPLAYPCFQAAAGAMDSRDNADIHYQDTVREGKGLADQNLARVLADEAVSRFHDLEKYGVKFETEHGKLFQAHFPGQTYPRNLLIVGGGFGLISGLKNELRRHQRAKIIEDLCISRLLIEHGELAGAFGLNLRDGQFYAIEAKSVVLACGGYEALWENNDGSADSTGDGISLAFGVGADIIDSEMTQYYPGVFAYPESLKGVDIQYETFLEKRYFDFKLLNKEGKEFLPEGPLPGRDVLMRAIFTEIEQGRGTEHNAVYVDPTRSSKSYEEIDRLVQHFVKSPDKYWRKIGIDIRTDRIEICPAVHYTLGGIRINEKAETSVQRLFAAGENSSNTHGANRIGGNSLAETQVFGAMAGKQASIRARKHRGRGLPERQIREEISHLNFFAEEKREGVRPFLIKKELRELMDQYVGPNRNEGGLKIALNKVLDLKRNALPNVQVGNERIFNVDWCMAIEVARALDLAELVIRSAMFRKETRGHHYRSDFPRTLENPQHTLIKKRGDKIVVNYAPVNRLR